MQDDVDFFGGGSGGFAQSDVVLVFAIDRTEDFVSSADEGVLTDPTTIFHGIMILDFSLKRKGKGCFF